MLSQQSLRRGFLVKLSMAMAMLLLLFSLVLYVFIRHNIKRELQYSLSEHASYLFSHYDDLPRTLSEQREILRRTLGIDAEIRRLGRGTPLSRHFETIEKEGRFYLRGFFPYQHGGPAYLVLTRDVTQPMQMVRKVYRSIVLLTLAAMLLIILYAFFLSRMLIAPISFFSGRLSRMNENLLEPIDLEKIPSEFRPLGHSVNQLVARVKNYILYNKELFVGTAHELKTPLAVMKTRSQVALIKKDRSVESLEKTLRENIGTIDEMSRMVATILQFGRAEGAQLDQPERFDLIAFLRQRAEEFRLLAHTEGKEVFFRSEREELPVTLQPTLLMQIVQNLLQNALRYTPPGGSVELRLSVRDGRIRLQVLDEGPGIDPGIDPFAPFQRSKDSPGAGLGLFLVKNAADTLEGTITLENRPGGVGAVATLTLPCPSEENPR